MDTGWIGAAISGAENSMDRQGGTIFNHYWARRNEEFNRSQADSAYSRAVADMQRAGLNPMLAYSQGGASSAQGAKAQYERGGRDPGAAYTSGAVAREQIANMRAQNRLLDLEGDKSEVEKTFYQAFLPLARELANKLGAWSAESAKGVPKLLSPSSSSPVDITGQGGQFNMAPIIQMIDRAVQGFRGLKDGEMGRRIDEFKREK